MSFRSLRVSLNFYRKCCSLPQRRLLRTMDTATHTSEHPTINKLTTDLANIMGIEVGYKPIPKSREHLQELIPLNQEELPPRTMKDSFVIGIIPLGSDPILQEKYVSLTGQVRVSRFLEDMDIFAVVVAQKYLLNPRVKPGMHSPYTIVTALVDRIEFTEYTPKLTKDVRILGHVSWVGRSSMEVVVWLDQLSQNNWYRIIQAVFLLAIRDAINCKSVPINRLIPQTDEEKEIFNGGEKRKALRLKMKQQELSETLPSADEQKVIHDLYKRTFMRSDLNAMKHQLPVGCIWMDECVLSNVVHSYPQHRNLHYTVFGGFLMRQAAELSSTLGLLFSKFTPVLKSISDITFTEPVSMTALLTMHAHVVFTESNYIQIKVFAKTNELTRERHTTTNSFHFMYEVPEVARDVFPKTYGEAMLYIDGRRHFYEVVNSRPEFAFKPITSFISDTKN